MEKCFAHIHYIRCTAMLYIFFFILMTQRYAILQAQKPRFKNSVGAWWLCNAGANLMFLAGIFYFTLGNLPPKTRSKLSSIYLVTILKHRLLCEYGMDRVLDPFIEDIKKLVCKCHLFCTMWIHICSCQENGHLFHVRGGDRIFYGALATVSADNLGPGWLQGELHRTQVTIFTLVNSKCYCEQKPQQNLNVDIFMFVEGAFSLT